MNFKTWEDNIKNNIVIFKTKKKYRRLWPSQSNRNNLAAHKVAKKATFSWFDTLAAVRTLWKDLFCSLSLPI